MRRVLIIAYHFPPFRYWLASSHGPGQTSSPIRLGAHRTDSQIAGWSSPSGADHRDRLSGCLGTVEGQIRLDPKRGIHQQFSLPRAKTPNRVPPHTRLMKWLKPLLLFPDASKGWRGFAMDAISQLKEHTAVDAILTTSP